MGLFINFLASFLRLYQMVLMVRIIMTWFPAINWYNQPWRTLADITDPVLAPFRRLIPPIGGLDLSPIVVFFLLQLLEQFLASFRYASY